MRGIILFEDKASTPSSCLLRYGIDEYVFQFTGSDGQLLKLCRNAVKEGYECIFIFVDLPVNNRKCIRLYRNLYKAMCLYEHVEVLPIICIEELMFHAISKVQQLKVKNSVEAKEFCRIMSIFHKDLDKWIAECEATEICKRYFYEEGVLRSLEKLFKHIFKDCVTACQENVDNVKKGIYYKQDCNCADCEFRLQLQEKVQLLWGCFYAVPTGILTSEDIRSIDYVEYIQPSRQRAFDNIAAAIGVQRVELYPEYRAEKGLQA